MFRLNRHSRRGHFMMGISAADNALWDPWRYYGVPVYRLLVGHASRGQAYGSCLGWRWPDAAHRKRPS
jgi:L-alanine-DL-glutamate epimerase-like enolase superfamily enzyme